METQVKRAQLTADEKRELLEKLLALDVTIVRTGAEKWQYVQEQVGDGYSAYSNECYDSEDEAILAAAENWSL